MQIAIIGCGYTGERLARKLVESGHRVKVTNRTDEKHGLYRSWGLQPIVFAQDDSSEDFEELLSDVEVVYHLAPPNPSLLPAQIAQKLRNASPNLRVCIYGSTTGVYGRRETQNEWIDELSECGPRDSRGQRRADMETALRDAGVPTKVVRIAGIYGPGRTLASRVRSPDWPLFEDAPNTSRIHVDDLVSILQGMHEEKAPDLINACDDLPCTTLEVARFTAGLLKVDLPALVTREEARQKMSEIAWSFRSNGRTCRSIYREQLVGPLLYPTYEEGVTASLAAEGLI
ncbi:MAG: NAD-dependent epimerase/dehydratase family protein [Myxococcota bacterium]|nr:NAD-dependent epimerase/dehydratase family protein [Myxococcota bacterium]